MRKRLTDCGLGRPIHKYANRAGWFLLILFALFFAQSCKWGKDSRLTTVYGKVTDQAGQPVDSVSIIFAGHKGVSGGVPIKETYTDSTGTYQIMVDVPRKYLYASI